MTIKQLWHNIDIVAAVKKTSGFSLRRLSLKHGMHESGLQQALHKPYPKAEKIISETIGVPVSELWPTRYDSNGSRIDKRMNIYKTPVLKENSDD